MALLKNTELMVTFRDAITGSTAITSWLTTNYPTSTLKVFTGIDQKNPPGESDAPFVCLIPSSAVLGETTDSHQYSMEIVVGLVDDTFSDYATTGATEMKGVFNLDSICHLIIEELRTLSTVQNWMADSINLQNDSITYFPLHMGTIGITSSFQNVLGYDIKLNGAE